MSRLSGVLLEARRSAGLDASAFARLVRSNDARIEDLEAGALPTPEELDEYALVFGITVDALVRGDATRSPTSRLLFRVAEDDRQGALDALTETEAYRVFGDFLRAVHQLAELDDVLGRPRPRHVSLNYKAPPYQADELASWLRDELQLGLEPIRSMRELMDELDIPVFFVTPEQLDPAVDGASTSIPRPAVLANLIEGGACWWRTRMTLAHELCHLIVDHRDGDQPAVTISPHARSGRGGRARKRFDLYNEFDLVERRAGAFAACFLAPRRAVLDCVGHRDPTSEDAIARVGETFGIGRIAACYRLKHVYSLSDATHRAMMARGPVDWTKPADHPDRGPGEVGLRAGVLRERALAALAQGHIDRARCHEYLDLPFTESLPAHGGLSDEQRKPLRKTEDAIRGVAQRYLQVEVSGDLIATNVTAGEPDGWHVDVVQLPERIPAGMLVISYDRVPLHYEPRSSGSPQP
jgi:transcriptional regulator with XRE-family HTH domain